MPIEPVKIPQNVYVEDRIVGPVTLRQLIILLLTGGFSYVLWTGIKSQTGYASIFTTILCWIPFVIGAAFAFVRIQQISLMRFILLAAEKIDKPIIRRWAPRRGISINFQYFSVAADAADKAKKTAAAAQPHREKLAELSALLDLGPLVTTPREEMPLPPEKDPMTTQRPVDPSRISVSTQEGSASLDNILERTDPSPRTHTPPTPTPSLLDIFPPTAPHAR